MFHKNPLRVDIVHRIVCTVGIGSEVVVFLCQRVHAREAGDGRVIIARTEVIEVIAVHSVQLLAAELVGLHALVRGEVAPETSEGVVMGDLLRREPAVGAHVHGAHHVIIMEDKMHGSFNNQSLTQSDMEE